MVESVVGDMLGNATAGVTIVLVLTAEVELEAEQLIAAARGAQLSFLVLGGAETGAADLAAVDSAAAATGGASVLVAAERAEVELYYSLLGALHAVTGAASRASHSVHRQQHPGHLATSSGHFYTEEEAEAVFRVYVPDTEDHMVRAVTFRDLDTGRVFGPYTKMSASYDLVNYKTPNIVGELPWSSGGGGRRHWNYTVSWFPGAEDTTSIISVTAARTQARLTSWTSAVDTWGCEDGFQHVRVSALLSSPHVSGVEVVASVRLLTDNGTELQLPDLRLARHGDQEESSLHSAVLLSYPAPGRYTLRVRAEDLITGEVTTDPRTVEHVVRVARVPARDCVPPGQVLDLSIAIYNNSDVVTAAWTAPGGDLELATSDRVEMFRLVASEDVCGLLDSVQTQDTVLSVQTLAGAGQRVEQVLQWPPTRYDTTFYVAVVGVDAAGNVGHVSNIVTVFVPAPVSEETVETEAVSLLGAGAGLLDNYQTVIIISSSLGGVLMLCLLAIVYIIVSGRYRRQAKASQRGAASPDYTIETEGEGGGGGGVTSVQQILARERQSRGAVQPTPVYWSCDQILGQSQASPGLHNYYNYTGQPDTGAGCHQSQSQSRHSCSSESYSSQDTESWRCHSSQHSQHGAHPSSCSPAHTPHSDEGYDSASRELELINSRKLYTIV